MVTPKKGRKSISLWETCGKCQAVIFQKDISAHKNECNAELFDWNWKYNFIKNNVLYTVVVVYNESDDINLSDDTNVVFVSSGIMEMFNILPGDPVILHFKHTTVIKLAKCNKNGKSLTNISLIRNAIKLDQLEGPLKLRKLTSPVYHIDDIILTYKGKYKLPPWNKLTLFLNKFNQHKIITKTNNVSFWYYGRSFIFQIDNIKSSNVDINEDSDLKLRFKKLSLTNDFFNQTFYKIVCRTNWKIKHEQLDKPKLKHKLINVYGYEDVIKEINDIIDISVSQFNENSKYEINRGILIYGFLGVGKSMIAEAVLNTRKESLVIINFLVLYSKLFSEIEIILRTQFDEAKYSAPSIIYIEDLDTLLHNNNLEKKIINILIKLLDEVQDCNIAILATTSNLEATNSMLRRPGRLSRKIEIYTPNQNTRRQMFKQMLKNIDHDLNDDDIAYVTSITHGYVGIDLENVCSEAVNIANKCRRNNDCDYKTKVITREHVIKALKNIKPLAMKEISVEVCDVRWQDIAGQEKLKLRLKEIVNLPSNHKMLFEKFNMVPPKGVLLYGPPGCSKTMIVKAWVTESKLNFFNIKGSNLFSKFVGDSEKAIRDIFKKAKQVAPSIIFFDEVDAIGRERGANLDSGSNRVENRVLAELLTHLDGLNPLGNIFVIAATNRPNRIDPALLRPGRFDRLIYVPLPDAKTREEIFNIKFKNMPLDTNVNIQHLVDRTEGYSCAEVNAVCKEAALNALKNSITAEKVTMNDFDVALLFIKPKTRRDFILMYEKFESSL